MLSLFRQRRIVDDQPSVGAANHPVGFGEQGFIKWRGVPHAAGDEVMKLIVADLAVARRHGLHALTITNTDQPRDINRAHACPCLVPESTEERCKPPIKIRLPGLVHGRPSMRPTTHESRKTQSGNPKTPEPSKKCQSSARFGQMRSWKLSRARNSERSSVTKSATSGASVND